MSTHVVFSVPAMRYWGSGIWTTSTIFMIQNTRPAIIAPKKIRKNSTTRTAATADSLSSTRRHRARRRRSQCDSPQPRVRPRSRTVSQPQCRRSRAVSRPTSAGRRRLHRLDHVEVVEGRRPVAERGHPARELRRLGALRVGHRLLVGGELDDGAVDAGLVAVGGDDATNEGGAVPATAELVGQRPELVDARAPEL